MADHVMRSFEPGLWTVGTTWLDNGTEKFDPIQDHDDQAAAEEQVRRLNGGAPAPASMIGDRDAYTGPDGEHADVGELHRETVAAVLPGVPMEVGMVVAQLLADVEARAARAGYNDGHHDAMQDVKGAALAEATAGDGAYLTGEHMDSLRATWATMPYAHGLAWDSPDQIVGAMETLAGRLQALAVRDVEQAAELQRHRASLVAVAEDDRPALADAWAAGWTAGDEDAHDLTNWRLSAGPREDNKPEPTRNPYVD